MSKLFNDVVLKLATGNVNGGLKKSDLQDKKLQLIFSAVDTGEGKEQKGKGDTILTDEEMKTFLDSIKKFAGKNDKLSKKEAKKLLKEYGLNDKVSVKDLKEFIDVVLKQGGNVASCKLDGDDIIITYKENQAGQKTETLHKNKSYEIKQNTSDSSVTELRDEKNNLLQKKTVQNVNGNKITETIKYAFDAEGSPILEEGTPVIDEKVQEQSEKGLKITTKYADGKPQTIIEEQGTNEKQYQYYGQDAYIQKEVKNKGLPDEETTVYNRANDGSLLSTTTDNKDKKIFVQYDENDIIQEITLKNENGKLTPNVETNKYNNEKYLLTQKKVVDGKEYSLSYDGKGNTKIIVQNGESIKAIAEKFSIDEEKLRKLNSAENKKYFNVGAEILLPGEFSADDERLINRKSSEDALKEYKATVRQQKTVVKTTRGPKRDDWQKEGNWVYTQITFAKGISAEDIAKTLYNYEGIKNPSEQDVKRRAAAIENAYKEHFTDGKMNKKIKLNYRISAHDAEGKVVARGQNGYYVVQNEEGKLIYKNYKRKTITEMEFLKRCPNITAQLNEVKANNQSEIKTINSKEYGVIGKRADGRYLVVDKDGNKKVMSQDGKILKDSYVEALKQSTQTEPDEYGRKTVKTSDGKEYIFAADGKSLDKGYVEASNLYKKLYTKHNRGKALDSYVSVHDNRVYKIRDSYGKLWYFDDRGKALTGDEYANAVREEKDAIIKDIKVDVSKNETVKVYTADEKLNDTFNNDDAPRNIDKKVQEYFDEANKVLADAASGAKIEKTWTIDGGKVLKLSDGKRIAVYYNDKGEITQIDVSFVPEKNYVTDQGSHDYNEVVYRKDYSWANLAHKANELNYTITAGYDFEKIKNIVKSIFRKQSEN